MESRAEQLRVSEVTRQQLEGEEAGREAKADGDQELQQTQTVTVAAVIGKRHAAEAKLEEAINNRRELKEGERELQKARQDVRVNEAARVQVEQHVEQWRVQADATDQQAARERDGRSRQMERAIYERQKAEKSRESEAKAAHSLRSALKRRNDDVSAVFSKWQAAETRAHRAEQELSECRKRRSSAEERAQFAEFMQRELQQKVEEKEEELQEARGQLQDIISVGQTLEQRVVELEHAMVGVRAAVRAQTHAQLAHNQLTEVQDKLDRAARELQHADSKDSRLSPSGGRSSSRWWNCNSK